MCLNINSIYGTVLLKFLWRFIKIDIKKILFKTLEIFNIAPTFVIMVNRNFLAILLRSTLK
ncbi:hypothetical protein [Mocis latipes granulovirus]|uniref:Uncharacterized protein n=1 Tax=Mocis latipes granulovirus TaxID=2072024 RepID=A0A162GVY0_9BBAC|nr:hypothetical protein [Mocis latipes granulovirus]AKR17448.1 hypothetical protein [Mocis latipes granulovirus]